MGSGIGAPTLAKEERQVPRAFARIEQALDRLEVAINNNANALQSLLRTEPNTEGKESLKREVQVPIASMLTDIEDKVNDLTDKLESVQRRLEL